MKAILFVALCAAPIASAQVERRPWGPPEIRDVAYGPHERHRLDLWQARSKTPAPLVIYIHGGGFTTWDKSTASPFLLEACLSKGISVAAINYRYRGQAPLPAPMYDAARAVQFLRYHAREWNLNPNAFAATGGSAGGGMSLWLGFHPDMADPASDDPVKRQSTRVSAMGTIDAQVSYDPRFIEKLFGPPAARMAFWSLFGLRKEEAETERAHRLYDEASPIVYLTAGAPPAFMFYWLQNLPVTAESKTGSMGHSPAQGYYLKERMDKLGIECSMHLRDDYEGHPEPDMYRQMIAFFQKQFPR